MTIKDGFNNIKRKIFKDRKVEQSTPKCINCGRPTNALYCSYKCKDEDDMKQAIREAQKDR